MEEVMRRGRGLSSDVSCKLGCWSDVTTVNALLRVIRASAVQVEDRLAPCLLLFLPRDLICLPLLLLISIQLCDWTSSGFVQLPGPRDCRQSLHDDKVLCCQRLRTVQTGKTQVVPWHEVFVKILDLACCHCDCGGCMTAVIVVCCECDGGKVSRSTGRSYGWENRIQRIVSFSLSGRVILTCCTSACWSWQTSGATRCQLSFSMSNLSAGLIDPQTTSINLLMEIGAHTVWHRKEDPTIVERFIHYFPKYQVKGNVETLEAICLSAFAGGIVRTLMISSDNICNTASRSASMLVWDSERLFAMIDSWQFRMENS
eukprot:754230-Hanusia_phi.AAC.7